MEIETLGPLTGTVRATFSGLERTWDLEVRYFFQISQWKQRFEEFCHAPNLLLHLQQKVARGEKSVLIVERHPIVSAGMVLRFLSNRFGLIRKRECWMPTVRGWVALFLVVLTLGYAGVHTIFPFLQLDDPLISDVMVVDGWVPDYMMAEVGAEFERGGYKILIITGGTIIKGEPLAEQKSYPELTRAALRKNGWDPEKVVAVPCGDVVRDRTYASAVALKEWLAGSPYRGRSFNIYSRGAHCRRTRLLYQLAFKDTAQVGVIAGKDRRYDGARWWISSEGVRDIIDETIAYFYARVVFRPV